MSGGFTFPLDVCNGQNLGGGWTTGFGYGVTVTTSSTANSKGSWVQLVSATSADICWLNVMVQYYNASSGSGNRVAIDIGIGASGSEQVIVSNLLYETAGTYCLRQFSFPINIPAGTRVAVRAQSTAGSESNLTINVDGFDGAFECDGSSGVDALGFVSASTTGTAITPGNQTSGSYSQLIASTSRDYAGIFAALEMEGNTGGRYAQFDIAIGGSGSEKIILPSSTLVTIGSTSAGLAISNSNDFLPISIPAGTRIAVRGASTDTNTFGVVVYGVYK